MKCPDCGSKDSFRILAWEVVGGLYFVDFDEHMQPDIREQQDIQTLDGLNVAPNADVKCMECDHEGTLFDFTTEIKCPFPIKTVETQGRFERAGAILDRLIHKIRPKSIDYQHHSH